MKNPYIEKVEEWREDKDSVTQAELNANLSVAKICAANAEDDGESLDSDIADAAAAAAEAAATANAATANTEYWVKRYYDLTHAANAENAAAAEYWINHHTKR